jgi:RNA polymerase sigma-70 factor (ECF subfamily)
MSDPTVSRLLPGASRGDPAALEELIRSFRPAIYRYCRSRLPDHEAAEDVTQEVTLAMVEALPRHRSEDHSVGAFVFGIASNKVAMWHRATYRRPEVPGEHTPESVDPTPGPAEIAESNDGLARLMGFINQLPERFREILMLRIAAGLSAEEAGQVLGLTAGAVRVTQHRALTRLREIAALEVQP